MVLDWKTNCFLCTKPAYKKYSTVNRVETIPFIKTLTELCESRDDKWAEEVSVRLAGCSDLVAEEAIYHTSCMNRFRLWVPSENQRGRPVDQSMMENFKRICIWLEEEGDSELYTIQEILEKMKELAGDTPCYSIKHLRRKLTEYYKEHIFFAKLPGKSDLVCFRDMASFLLNKLRKMEKQTSNDIIVTAAKIIKSDLRVLTTDKSHYPLLEKMSDIEYCKTWTPESLLILLNCLIPKELQAVGIGQCIAQASRPRSLLASIPFGIGVDIDKSFATCWRVDHLAKFGLSVTSDEVTLFKQSTSVSNAEETESEEDLIQWVADNADYNTITLTGKELSTAWKLYQ